MKTMLLVFFLSQAADITTTVVGINHGCKEINPLYQSRSATQMIAIKGLSTLMISSIAWGLHKSGRTKHAKLILVVGSLVGGGAAGWNMHVMPKC